MTSAELLALTDVLKSHWTQKPEIHSSFGLGGREKFLEVNVAAFNAQRASTGRDVRDLIGTFQVQETP